MPRMDLKQNFRFTDGRLYRAGKGVQVPEGFGEWMGVVMATASPQTAPPVGAPDGGEDEGYPYADMLKSAGFEDWAEVRAATDAELLAVDGIGPKRVAEIRAYGG